MCVCVCVTHAAENGDAAVTRYDISDPPVMYYQIGDAAMKCHNISDAAVGDKLKVFYSQSL